MNITIETDFSQYANQTLNFCIHYERADAHVALTLPALKVKNGVEVKNLTVTGESGQGVPFTIREMLLGTRTADTAMIEAALHRRKADVSLS